MEARKEEFDQIIKVEVLLKTEPARFLKLAHNTCQVQVQVRKQVKRELRGAWLTFGESKSLSPLRAKSVLANVRVVRTTTLILYFQNPGSTNANTSFEIYLLTYHKHIINKYAEANPIKQQSNQDLGLGRWLCYFTMLIKQFLPHSTLFYFSSS